MPDGMQVKTAPAHQGLDMGPLRLFCGLALRFFTFVGRVHFSLQCLQRMISLDREKVSVEAESRPQVLPQASLSSYCDVERSGGVLLPWMSRWVVHLKGTSP